MTVQASERPTVIGVVYKDHAGNRFEQLVMLKRSEINTLGGLLRKSGCVLEYSRLAGPLVARRGVVAPSISSLADFVAELETAQKERAIDVSEAPPAGARLLLQADTDEFGGPVGIFKAQQWDNEKNQYVAVPPDAALQLLAREGVVVEVVLTDPGDRLKHHLTIGEMRPA